MYDTILHWQTDTVLSGVSTATKFREEHTYAFLLSIKLSRYKTTSTLLWFFVGLLDFCHVEFFVVRGTDAGCGLIRPHRTTYYLHRYIQHVTTVVVLNLPLRNARYCVVVRSTCALGYSIAITSPYCTLYDKIRSKCGEKIRCKTPVGPWPSLGTLGMIFLMVGSRKVTCCIYLCR